MLVGTIEGDFHTKKKDYYYMGFLSLNFLKLENLKHGFF